MCAPYSRITHRFGGLPQFCLSFLVAAAGAAFAVSAQAQNPEPEYDFSAIPEIQKRLDVVRQELRDLPAESNQNIRGDLEHLELICLSHIDATQSARAQIRAREETVEAARAWDGFDIPPPYPLRFRDNIKEDLSTLTELRSAEETQLAVIARAMEEAGKHLAAAQQSQRKAEDAARAAETPDAQRTAEKVAAEASLTSRIHAEDIGRMKSFLSAHRAALAATNAKLDLAEIQIQAVGDQVTFTTEELDEILSEIEIKRRRLLDAHGKDPVFRSWWAEFFDLEKRFWDLRFQAFHSRDAAERKELLAAFDKMKSRIEDWSIMGQQRLEQQNLDAVEVDGNAVRDSLREISRLRTLIGFAITETGGVRSAGKPIFDRLKATLADLWDTELYLAEETAFIDGRKVTSARAVTVGKVVWLAVILIIGVIILRYGSARVKTTVGKRANLPLGTADLAARAAFGFGLVMLFLYGLNAVHIPLTAFAFLGGALAIGIGFGMQTILKNFISGIILIFERPFKIGDLVEVDGVTGNIQQIGLRASVLRHFDGVETLIPNSFLLENKVTNSTFSSTVLRHEIVVGVAYGSPTRQVAKILLAVANEHGLVLESPAPEVRFEDFGDSALIFRLFYWFDSTKATRAGLASDLRFMIEKGFAESEISIPFPQRDIHLDSGSPLHVEIARRQKPEAAPATDKYSE